MRDPSAFAIRLVGNILILFLALATAHAGETRVALVIGNSAYASVPKLENTTNDAVAVANGLRSAGFQTVQVETDLGQDALRRALQTFAALADDADWALVYYAGHGIEVGGVNYLVPVDARLRSDRDVAYEAVSLDTVLTSLEGARKIRLVLLDACRDNPFLGAMKRSLATRSVGRGLAEVEPTTAGTLISYAAKAGQVAFDEGDGNGPYAAALVKNLATAGLEVEFFFRHVRADVLGATGKRQEPATYGSLPPERFVFRAESIPGTPALPAAELPVNRPPDVPRAPAAPLRAADTIDGCDRLAASPSDPDRPRHVMGVMQERIEADRAVPACRAAIALAPRERRLGLQLGRALLAAGEAEESRKAFEKAAGQGSTDAMLHLAIALVTGRGGPRDLTAARRQLATAAQGGHTGAMAGLGVLLRDGVGGPRDLDGARDWLRKAADLGDASALAHLGVLYENGHGVPQDAAEARRLYKKAADLGEADGMAFLGVLTMQGIGGPRDDAAAHQLFERAASIGNGNGMVGLGLLAALGRGLPKDDVVARRWFEKAADLGNVVGMTALGMMWREGRGGPRDYAAARRLHETAAELGNAAALNGLGVLYENGQGVAQDKPRARGFYARAAELGDADAMTNLGAQMLTNETGPQDDAGARRLFQKAAERGNALAMTALGVLYSVGRGGGRDPRLARQWLTKGAELGNADAKRLLANMGR